MKNIAIIFVLLFSTNILFSQQSSFIHFNKMVAKLEAKKLVA